MKKLIAILTIMCMVLTTLIVPTVAFAEQETHSAVITSEGGSEFSIIVNNKSQSMTTEHQLVFTEEKNSLFKMGVTSIDTPTHPDGVPFVGWQIFIMGGEVPTSVTGVIDPNNLDDLLNAELPFNNIMVVAQWGGGSDEEDQPYGYINGSDRPALVELTKVDNDAPENKDYYTYLCQLNEEIYLTPSFFSENENIEWLEWETPNTQNTNGQWKNVSQEKIDEDTGRCEIQKDSSQMQFIRAKVTPKSDDDLNVQDDVVGDNATYYDYMLYLCTPNIEPANENIGEVYIDGRKYLGEDYGYKYYSSFINGALYEDIPAIVKEAKDVTIILKVLDVAEEDLSSGAKVALGTVGHGDTLAKYFKISVKKKIGEIEESIDWHDENIQGVGIYVDKSDIESPGADVIVREFNVYQAAAYETDAGTRWAAQIIEETYEPEDGESLMISTKNYSGIYKMTYVDKDEVYYHENMLKNMGKADYHCKGKEDEVEGYYNAFNRTLWYAIYSGSIEQYGMGVDDNVYVFSVEGYYDMISSLFDESFDENNELGLNKESDDGIAKMAEALESNLVANTDEDGFSRYTIRYEGDEESDEEDSAKKGEIIEIAINTEINFGDSSYVKYRMAKPVTDDTSVLMGIFLNPLELTQTPYSPSPRLVNIDGSRYELISSAELFVKEVSKDISENKISSYKLYDYFITDGGDMISLDKEENEIALSPKRIDEDGNESMYDVVTVSTTIKDFEKLKELKLIAEEVDTDRAEVALEKTDVEAEEIYSNDIYLHDGNTKVSVDGLKLTKEKLSVRIKIPAEWVEAQLKLENIRAYYIPEDEDKKAEYHVGELKQIDGEYYYVFETNHFSEYSLALLTDDSITNLPNNSAGGSDSNTGTTVPDKTATDKAANTGDNFNAIPFITIMVIAIAGVAVAMFRRKTVK